MFLHLFVLAACVVEERSSEVNVMCSDLGSLMELVKSKLGDLNSQQHNHTQTAQDWVSSVQHFCTQTKVSHAIHKTGSALSNTSVHRLR